MLNAVDDKAVCRDLALDRPGSANGGGPNRQLAASRSRCHHRFRLPPRPYPKDLQISGMPDIKHAGYLCPGEVHCQARLVFERPFAGRILERGAGLGGGRGRDGGAGYCTSAVKRPVFVGPEWERLDGSRKIIAIATTSHVC